MNELTMHPDFKPEQPFGQRLLPAVVDEYAVRDPTRIYGSYVVSNNVSDGFRKVTMAELARGVNHVAWWIKKNIGTSTTFETIAYMGASDFRYPIFVLAAIKCGYKVLLPGTRNSVVQINGLFARTDCKVSVYSPEVQSVIQKLDVRSRLEIATLDQILAADADHFPYEKRFSDVINDPILVVHSSGTTGNPKIVTMTHGTVSVTDSDRFIACPDGRKPQNGAQFNFENGGGFYSCFPPYHLAGLQAFLILPIFTSKASIIIGPPTLPPNGDLLASIIEHQNGFIRAFYVPPSLIDQWAQLPKTVDQARQLDFILYGGGPLPPAVGESLNQVTDVCQMYGSVETGQIQLLVPRKGEGDWMYMEWNPSEEVDMQPSGEGTYELVLHQEQRFKQHRCLSHTFPDLTEWRSGDLFVEHPSKPGLWRYHGRIDDIIVLLNSHKIHPIAFENSIQNHSLVSGALMIGTGRVQPALLVELVPGAEITEALKLEVWKLIEESNALVPQYGRVTKSKVMFSKPEKPFPRAPKGSIVRKTTLSLYSEEIEGLYAGMNYLPNLNVDSSAEISSWVHETLRHILPDVQLVDDDDLFQNGMDSLKVTEFMSTVRRALSKAFGKGPNLSNQFLYQNPTISQLTTAILDLASGQKTANHVSGINGDEHASLDYIVGQYSDFQIPRAHRGILLTGATGLLGSHVLQSLLQEGATDTIFLFIRPGSRELSEKKLAAILEGTAARDLPVVEFIEADLSMQDLGLDSKVYTTLQSKVQNIIHLAWNVNFNLSIQSFAKYDLNGLRSLVNFSVGSARRPRIVYASSTAYAINWALSAGVEKIPEDILPNINDTGCSAYGLSKQVSERILEVAHNHTEVPITILRMGQIVDSAAIGLTPKKTDWVQAMILTSKNLGMIPTMQMPLDWIPADVVASVVIDATKSKALGTMEVQNVIHPYSSPWALLVKALQMEIPDAEVVTLEKWITAIENVDQDIPATLDRLPALKLKSFFQSLVDLENSGKKIPTLSMENAMRSSKRLREVESLDVESLVKRICVP